MPTPRFDIDQLLNLRRVSAVVPSPDGSWAAVAVARLDNDGAKLVTDLWRVELRDPSAPPRQLTRGDQSDSAPRFRRDGALGFLRPRKDDAGDERSQVWLLPSGGGEAYPLTDEPLGVLDFAFAKTGDRLAVIAPVLLGAAPELQRKTARERAKHGPSALRYTRMPVRLWDHWIPEAAEHVVAYDEHGCHRRDLTPSADREHRDQSFGVEWALSPDGATVAVSLATPGADRLDDVAWAIIDTATGASRVVGKAAAVHQAHPVFSPDGRSLACSRQSRSAERIGREQLWVYDLASGEGRDVAPTWDRWPVPHAFTPDGASVVATAHDQGCEPVFAVALSSGAVTRLTRATAGGSHGSLHVVDGAVVGIRHGLLQPPEPFRVALSEGAEPALLARLSGFEPGRGSAIARVSEYRVASDDGTEIQSFLVSPADAPSPRPALVWIHGGPLSHNADGWHWRWNPLIPAAAGYVVALPNPRGSTGFGQALIDGIWNNRWGAECYVDLMRATDALAARPEIDAGRIAAMGGSFGGYMANWIGGQTDRFRCLVTHASIYSMPLFHGATDLPAWLDLELGASPHRDPAAFERYSPHKHVATWKSPTLILHGERDYRVPISEALALFDALQAHGVASELVVFPDENHWILKPNNIRTWYHAWLSFVGKHMA